MEFLNATYLWGLLGILLPLAIHLWSRKKVVTIKVGSIKLLQASEPKQNSNIKCSLTLAGIGKQLYTHKHTHEWVSGIYSSKETKFQNEPKKLCFKAVTYFLCKCMLFCHFFEKIESLN